MAKPAVKKTTKKVVKKNAPKQVKLGVWAIVAGTLLAFLFGIALVIGTYVSVAKSPYEVKEITIEGENGLMGLYGYSNPFAQTKKVITKTTYKNNSVDDRFIQIKATFREKVGEPQEGNPGVDMGRYAGSVYSDKKLVKAGESAVFELPLVEFTNVPVRHVELEAFPASE